jgi:hydroxymethylpyrimidine/phosphomethylpyrimidine kinase
MTSVPPCVLTIAGSDSGSGAGVQADARAIHGLGGYALTAITALTAQNTRGVEAWEPVRPAFLSAQIAAVLKDFPVRAAKTGLLPGPAAIRAVARGLARSRRLALVVDPVIGSTSGTLFLSPAGVSTLKKVLLPRAALVTPNWPEAARLSGLPVTNREEVKAAAAVILRTGCRAVLIKGGHAPGDLCSDYLAMANGTRRWFTRPRLATANTHGTGCVLSAGIATGLAQGKSMGAAIAAARKFLDQGLRAGRKIPWGGRGPAVA